jgi:GGDEF domain-containing protein/AmiR/NasT family two-component response regulator
MARRILVADDSQAVVAAIRRDLQEDGREVLAVAPAGAAAAAAATRFGAALVRGTAGAKVLAAIRAADPALPVIVLFLDRAEAGLHPGVRGDAVLVGPFTPSGVTASCRLADELRSRGEKLAELEKRLARPGRAERDLEFLKRLLLVEVKRSRRYGFPISLALLSVDRWEEVVKDLAGPRERTALLAELLGVVSGTLRDIDIAVPFSEERLLVLMPHTKADGGLKVAARACALVRDRTKGPKLTVSSGVASHAGDGTIAFGDLVRRAGEALDRARAAGGDRALPADPPRKRDRISIG